MGGRISQAQGANKPGAKEPGGEPAKGRKSHNSLQVRENWKMSGNLCCQGNVRENDLGLCRLQITTGLMFRIATLNGYVHM